MVRKRLLSLSILLLLTFNILVALNLNTTIVSAAKYPSLYVDPPLVEGVTSPNTFNVSIKTDYNGSDITGYELTLYYNPSVIHAVSTTNGDLIVGGTAQFIPGTPDNTNGKITASAFFFFIPPMPAPTVSGPGTLANVTFTVVGVGNSSIALGTGMAETKLIGHTGKNEYDIINGFTGDEHLEDGYFNNVPPPIHDVAVTNLTAHPLQLDPRDPSQRIVKINVTVANQGNFTETFDVTIKYDSTYIDTQSVNNLLAGNSEIVNFVWNVTNIPLSTYTIEAEAILPSDDDPGDNIMTSDWKIDIVPEFSTLVPLLLMLALFAASTIALKRKTSNNHFR